MNNNDKIERLKSLESVVDNCIIEIQSLLPKVNINGWSRIQDSILDEMSKLEPEGSYDPKVQEYLNRKPYCLRGQYLEEVAIWEVRGEDPNCDLAGHHHNPYLFTAEGRLIDVLTKAVHTAGFWGWGGGGQVKKVYLDKV